MGPVLRPVAVLVDGDRLAAELTEHVVLDGVTREFAIAGFYRFDGGRIATATIYREGSADLPG